MLLPLLAFAVGGCAVVEGSGQPASRTPRLGDELNAWTAPIHGVEVNGPIRVEVSVTDAPQSVVLRADDNILDLVRLAVSDDGTLYVEPTAAFNPAIPIVVEVVTLQLDYLSARGRRASAAVTGIDAAHCGLAASDGARLDAQGQCHESVIIASGHAVLEAMELRVAEANVDALGGAWVHAHVSGRLDVHASGGSSVRINGSPSEVLQELTDGSTLTLE